MSTAVSNYSPGSNSVVMVDKTSTAPTNANKERSTTIQTDDPAIMDRTPATTSTTTTDGPQFSRTRTLRPTGSIGTMTKTLAFEISPRTGSKVPSLRAHDRDCRLHPGSNCFSFLSRSSSVSFVSTLSAQTTHSGAASVEAEDPRPAFRSGPEPAGLRRSGQAIRSMHDWRFVRSGESRRSLRIPRPLPPAGPPTVSHHSATSPFESPTLC